MSWHSGSGAMDPTAVQMQQIIPSGVTELQLQMSGVNGSLGPQRPPSQLQPQQQQQLHAQQPQLMNLQIAGNPNNPPNVNVSGSMHAIRMQPQQQPIAIVNSLNLANGMAPPNTAINPANNNVRILPPQSVAQFPIDAQMSQISHQQQFIVNAPILNTGDWQTSPGVPVTSVASIQFVQRADGTVTSQQASQPLQPNVQTQEEPKQRLLLVQQQLIYLLHAYKCGKQQQQPNAPACNTPNCAHYKQILIHISNCHSSRTCSCIICPIVLFRSFGNLGNTF